MANVSNTSASATSGVGWAPGKATLTTLDIAHIAPPLRIYAGLFTHVRNATHLRAQLLAGNEAFEYALIDAAMILSPQHLLAAVFRAANDALHDRIKSRNVHSEIVFCLSPNNNIAESFRRFGISDGSSSIVAVKVTGLTNPAHGASHDSNRELSFEAINQHLLTNVKGDLAPITRHELENLHDVAKIAKAYKFSLISTNPERTRSRHGVAASTQVDPHDVAGGQAGQLEVAILAAIALRGS